MLMIAFVAQRTSKLISRDDPFVTMTSSSNDDSLVELGKQGFMFAISDVDPKVGTLEAHYIKRSKNKEYGFEPIELVQCEEFLPGGKHEGKSNNELFDIEQLVNGRDYNHLCPLNITDISLKGMFDSEAFYYVKIGLKGCQLTDGTCFNDVEISRESLNFVLLKSSPNILGEHKSEMIEYLHDARHYYNLIPNRRQIENIFFRDVTMNLKD